MSIAYALCSPMCVTLCVCAPVACLNLVAMAGGDKGGTAGVRERRGEGGGIGAGEMGGSGDVHCICTLHPHACLSLCVFNCGLTESRHHGWEGNRGDSRKEGKKGGRGAGEMGGIR